MPEEDRQLLVNFLVAELGTKPSTKTEERVQYHLSRVS